MKEEDIQLSLGNRGDTITISGLREPSADEVLVMKKQILMAKKRGLLFNPNEDENTLILRMGAGKFGRFSQTYRVNPNQFDLNNIHAKYEGGQLLVKIPKRIPVHNPYYANPRGGSGFRMPSNFFPDEYLW
eukprot:TRINITY_DN3252_c0_g1_i3.p1 TRINITY_DN3252_c0_g1~~TRINITY_DN3252_c0_g1_i3.p1  ORF type:complete len:131 (-),score=45.97 TRINITY_DN3252_c0_g1_i3:192-584(-)